MATKHGDELGGTDDHGDIMSPDGKVALERLECNAACDYAPVVMVNWEFFDNQTPASAKQLVDDLRAGADVRPTRGPTGCAPGSRSTGSWPASATGWRPRCRQPARQPGRPRAGQGAGLEGASADAQAADDSESDDSGSDDSPAQKGNVKVTDTLTPILTETWDQPDSFTIEGYRRNGGYQALPKALA